MSHNHHSDQPIHPKVIKHLKKKLGASLEDGICHKKEHESWDRRSFLKMTGLATLGGALMLGKTPVQAFAPNGLLSSLGLADCGDRVLVLIRLKGGNDGLNTVILRENEDYYNIRPNIAVQEANLWALSDEFGMPNEMLSLQPMWEEGKMKVIHNVGYPNQNYSHFRSSDIWASASDSEELVTTGWMGRWLGQDLPSFLTAPPVVPPALQIGIQANLVFNADFGNLALSISNPAEFYQIAQTGTLYNTSFPDNLPSDKELKFARTVANSAFRYADSIQRAFNTGNNQITYPDNYLAEQMAIVARMIKGNLGTRVYMVSIGGFDTHSGQLDTHPILLQYLADSIKAMFDDLRTSGHAQNVLAMTFSEFGRTIFENGSLGTDHGTSAPMMVFGEEIESGFHGEAPDLQNVDIYGDLALSVDFRSVYGTVLKNWLCTPDEINAHIMGDDSPLIDDLLPPSSPPLGSNEVALLLGHNPADLPGTVFEIKYAIKRRGNVRLTVLNNSGQTIREILHTFQTEGSFTFLFNPNDFFLLPGTYFYRLEAGGRAYTRKIEWS